MNYLASRGNLELRPNCKGLGSDLKICTFTEYLVGGVPLVDYSWLYDNDPMSPKLDDKGKPIGDRWDYWTVDDFNWPQ